MSQILEAKGEPEIADPLMGRYIPLFKEWLSDLTPEEKEIWIWNALVGILRIKQKRKF